MDSTKKKAMRREPAALQAESLRLKEALEAVGPLQMGMESLSRAVGAAPFPVAAFDRDGVVRVASRALLRLAKRTASETAAGKINLLNRVTDENYALFEAVRNVFFGEACAVGLVRPLSLFVRGDGVISPDRYTRAVFCPVSEEDGRFVCGVLTLYEERQEKG